MFCKMDVDDEFRKDPEDFRVMGCDCRVPPSPPASGCGCSCPRCGAPCQECLGFGFVSITPRKFHEILSRIKAQIRRRVRTGGRPPGYLRLRQEEIEVVIRKHAAEDPTHWIRSYVEIGPPLRIYGVPIVTDRRKRI